MEKDSPLSIQSNESKDQCIICLSDISDDSINFPCIFSSCTCKYIMNLNCIKQYSINYCPICKAEIKYSKSIDLLKIFDFQNNTDNDITTNISISSQDKIRDLKIVIPTTNTTNRFRHVENDNNTCRNCNKICLICVPFFVIGFFISAYYLSSI